MTSPVVPQRSPFRDVLLNVWYQLSHRAFACFWRVVGPTTVGVKVIVTDPAGQVLLVKPRYHLAWNLPGGGVHKRETVDQAAVREIAEETGLRIAAENLRLLGVLSNFAEGKSDHVAVYHAPLPTGSALVRGIELEDAAFLSLDALPTPISPATRRRLAEFSNRTPMRGAW